mmetsp:Transcript_17482/g.54597  ORF Transcript_17482/g.54597 Transcript_17482/m.54597 type:complete len:331 (+) Transcript_17482:261-1253(+)
MAESAPPFEMRKGRRRSVRADVDKQALELDRSKFRFAQGGAARLTRSLTATSSRNESLRENLSAACGKSVWSWGEVEEEEGTELLRVKTAEATKHRRRARRWAPTTSSGDELGELKRATRFVRDGDVAALLAGDCSDATGRDIVEAAAKADEADRVAVVVTLGAQARLDDRDLFGDDAPLAVAATLEFARVATKAESLTSARAAKALAHLGLLAQQYVSALARLCPPQVATSLERRAAAARLAIVRAEEAEHPTTATSATLERAHAWRIDLRELATANKLHFDDVAKLPTDQRGFHDHSSKQLALTLAALARLKKAKEPPLPRNLRLGSA